MSGGIMDLVAPLLHGEAADKLSSFVGEGAGNTRHALEAAVPASIAGLADQASSEQGARGLLDQFRSGNIPQLNVSDVG